MAGGITVDPLVGDMAVSCPPADDVLLSTLLRTVAFKKQTCFGLENWPRGLCLLPRLDDLMTWEFRVPSTCRENWGGARVWS